MNAQNRYFSARTCDRCKAPLGASIMSKFDQAILCLACKADERLAPGYLLADEAEVAAVRRQEYNFPGVGLTAQDREFLAARLALRRAQATHQGAEPQEA